MAHDDSTDSSTDDETAAPGDSLGAVAVGIGLLGIVLLGIVLAIVTALVAVEAGRRAKAAGRSLENAYIAFVLSAVDGIVWIVIHLRFEVPFWAG